MQSPDRALIEAIGLSPVAMVVSNPKRADNPLEIVNQVFCELTGYPEDEVVGRNCRFLAGENTDETTSEKIRTAIHLKQATLVEILNYRRNGTPFRNGVLIAPIFDDEGELAWFLGSQVDLGPPEAGGLQGRRSVAAAKIDALAPRQRQVLQLMARGLLNKQIAWELKISEKTVKMHRALVLQRLGIATSAEAIRIAVEAGL